MPIFLKDYSKKSTLLKKQKVEIGKVYKILKKLEWTNDIKKCLISVQCKFHLRKDQVLKTVHLNSNFLTTSSVY